MSRTGALISTADNQEGANSRIITPKDPFPVEDVTVEKTAFGELSVAELTPTIQIQFPYTINSEILKDLSNGGTASIDNSMLKLSTGASANQSAEVRTKESIQYHPGQGTLVRFTSLFTTGLAGSKQASGIGDSSNGLFFGYSGADFGILRRTGGVREMRVLTVSTASSTAEDITITLDGDVKADVTVTASGDISTTAHEIADADYSSVGRGWEARSDGDGTILFISYDSLPRAGTYTLSSATTAVGSFAQALIGAAPTDSWILQADWNQDKADGLGVLPNIDFTKGNVFEIKFQWLGFGPMYFHIENPENGAYIPVHTIQYANANVAPSMANPTLPLSLIAENTSNTSDIILRAGSIAAFVEGISKNTHFHRGVSVEYSAVGTTETPILTLHNKEIFHGKENKIRIKLILFVGSADGTKPSVMRIRKDTKLIAASYSDVDGNSSVVEFDSSATILSNGSDQLGLGLGKSESQTLDLEEKSYFLNPGELFTITQKATAGTVDGVVSVNWEELH